MSATESKESKTESTEPETAESAAKKRGRPKGSKNKKASEAEKAADDKAAGESAEEVKPARSAKAKAAPKDKHADDKKADADDAGRFDGKTPRRRATKVSGGGQHQQRNQGRNQHRQRRQRDGRQQREYAPSVSKEELAELKVPELREKAAELNIDASGMKKADMVDAIYEALAIAEGFLEVEGILDILQDGYGFLRTQGYLPSEMDVYVGLSTIRRNGLRKGDTVSGSTRPAREGEKFAAIQKVTAINGVPVDEVSHRPKFSDLTPVFPDERLMMEHGKDTLTARVIDLASPIGKGQRGLIVSPPKAGKTTVLKDIAAAIHANNPEVHLMCLLVDERPEEVTDMERSIHGEVIASTFDMPSENHIAVAELVIERAKRLVEQGEAASSPAASTPRRCTRRSASWAPRATSREAARSPSSRRRSSTRGRRWTRSSSRSSRAPATWKSGSTATWPTAASSRPSTWSPPAPARRSCCSTRRRLRSSGPSAGSSPTRTTPRGPWTC